MRRLRVGGESPASGAAGENSFWQHVLRRLHREPQAVAGSLLGCLASSLDAPSLQVAVAGQPRGEARCPLSVLFAPAGAGCFLFLGVEVRGRYMGAWTMVWSAGQGAIGPMVGGLLFDRLGPHGSYGLIVVVGLAGACLYPLLRSDRRAVAAPVGEPPV